MNLPSGFRQSLKRLGRGACEAVGVRRYSRPALHGIDCKLERHLDQDGGIFIEAGANDGVRQSNTYYFERIRGWTGLLVEPVPELAAECRKNRRASVVAEAALAAEDVPGATVELHVAGLMSTVDGALGDAAATARHVAMARDVQRLPAVGTIRVPARTLSALIDEARIERPIDLLSLDVEGAEVAALRGLDWSRHVPRFICVEARDAAGIAAVLEPRYRVAEVLTDAGTHRDLLYARR
ncbi:MAG: FkbM family methyltransferase [Verrucomicrobia bacterium]|nr:FkbM family methyltransferase [Verrucomicrobiota bacterium]